MQDYKLKICGLTHQAGVDAALASGADYLGFMFFPPSPRHLDVAQALPLMQRVDGRAQTVAVLVNPTPDQVSELVGAVHPDIIQLHGDETPALVSALRAVHPGLIWKAIGIGTAADLAKVDEFESVVDGFLFDAKPPKDATRPGGLGTAFDWQILKGYRPVRQTLLAGGLTLENVGKAVEVAGLDGVDVSSSVESAPGNKSPQLIAEFSSLVRAAAARRAR